MESFSHTIAYYLTETGKKPFKDWLDGLKDVTARAKIRVRLDRVRLGLFGDHRFVGEGVYELKVNHGPGYRVYYACDGDNVILLLLGGDKSRQEKDIAQAKTYWQDHQRRFKHD